MGAHDCIKQMTNKKYRNDKTKTRRLKEVENAATPTGTPKQSPSKNNNANSDSDSKSTSSGTESSKETAPKPEAHEQVRYQNWGNTQNYGQHQSYSKQLQATPYAQSWNNNGYEQTWSQPQPQIAAEDSFPRAVVEQMPTWDSTRDNGTFGSSHYTTSFSNDSNRSFATQEGVSFGPESRLYEYGSMTQSMSGSIIGSSAWDASSSNKSVPSIPNKWSASQVSQVSSPARISCGESEIDEDEIIHL